MKDIQIDTVFLPFVYGNTWSEGLNFLNKIPRPLADFLFLILKSLKPSVKIQTIADWLQVSANPIKNQILLSEGQANNIIYQFSKRVFDVCAALFIIVAFCWLFAIISLVIFVSSGSPILFRQTRVGKNMEPFVLFKFRTMEAETKDLPTHLVSVSSVTKVGKFLRKIKLDEMPQVFNILRNDLCFNSPRPSLINQKRMINERKISSVFSKPGVTGLGQIKSIDMDQPVFLASVDEEYVKLQSWFLDIRIL